MVRCLLIEWAEAQNRVSAKVGTYRGAESQRCNRLPSTFPKHEGRKES